MDRELRERQIVPAQSLPRPWLGRCQCVGDGRRQQFVATVALRAGVRCQKTTVDLRSADRGLYSRSLCLASSF